MNKYKRLTERYIDEQGTNCVRKLAWDGEILHRLAELEDRIENGDLISTSDVGDNEIEFFVKHNADVRKETAKEILNAVDKESSGQTISITNYLRKKYGVEVAE